MYCIKTTRTSSELDDLLLEAMRLPVNAWVAGDKVEVKAYYKEELKHEEAALIRPATEVEVAEIGADAIIMVSSIETVTYNHKDMLVLLSSLLNTIELGYNGGDDTPVIFIKQNTFSLNPALYKYFGADNKVMRPIFAMLERKPSDIEYCNTDEDIPDPSVMTIYNRTRVKASPGEDNIPGGGLYRR